MSPVMQARNALGLSRAVEKFGARFFGSGARPGGIVSTSATLDDGQQALIRESWQSAQGGQNQGKTAFLYGDWKYQSIGLSPEEGQFLQTQVHSREQIASLFRVPVHMLDGTIVNNCPRTVILAMLLLITQWYENRAATSETNNFRVLPYTVESLLNQERFESFGFSNN
jgi:HK97 family phage portal protein